MYIVEKGKKKTDMKLMECAADFYIKALKIPKNIKLTIAFTDQHMGKKYVGRCWSHGDEHLVNIRKSMETSQKLRILAHELTHVKQHVKGEYIFTPKNENVNVIHHGVNIGNLSDYVYKESPWEIEAKKNETRLYNRFMKLTLLTKEHKNA